MGLSEKTKADERGMRDGSPPSVAFSPDDRVGFLRFEEHMEPEVTPEQAVEDILTERRGEVSQASHRNYKYALNEHSEDR